LQNQCLVRLGFVSTIHVQQVDADVRVFEGFFNLFNNACKRGLDIQDGSDIAAQGGDGLDLAASSGSSAMSRKLESRRARMDLLPGLFLVVGFSGLFFFMLRKGKG